MDMLNHKSRPDPDDFDEKDISTKWQDGDTGRMTYRIDFDKQGRKDMRLCLWNCEADGKVKQVAFLTSSEMNMAFDNMDTQGIAVFSKTNSLYWGIYLVNMFVVVRDAVGWNVDAVVIEHSGGQDWVSCSVELYRDRDAFTIEVTS